jgi:Holliday junction resolvasome RuvABC endonuclease subunit
MRVLGLDPSLTNYGWCLIEMGSPPVVIGKDRFQTKANVLFIDRYVSMRESIRTLCETHDVVWVGIESPPFGELWSEGLYGLFLYALEALHDQKVNVFFWDPMTVKSRAREISGREKGKMFKSDMIDAAKLLSGEKKWNADTADAFHIAYITGRFIGFMQGVVTDLTPKEQWIFTGVKTMIRSGKVIQRGMVFKENSRFFLFNETPVGRLCFSTNEKETLR